MYVLVFFTCNDNDCPLYFTNFALYVLANTPLLRQMPSLQEAKSNGIKVSPFFRAYKDAIDLAKIILNRFGYIQRGTEFLNTMYNDIRVIPKGM